MIILKTMRLAHEGSGDSSCVAMNDIHTHNLGYPRIGEHRELKKATESFWQGHTTLADLEAAGRLIRHRNWEKQRAAGIDLIPCNDFTFYDQMLDLSCLVGNVPARFGAARDATDLNTLFLVARGSRHQDDGGHDCADHACTSFASEMTKWFDTNYHYIVPEVSSHTKFRLVGDKVFREFEEATGLGYRAKPVLPGPATYLSLAKVQDPGRPDFVRFSLFDELVSVYEQLLQRLGEAGAILILQAEQRLRRRQFIEIGVGFGHFLMRSKCSTRAPGRVSSAISLTSARLRVDSSL